LFRPDLAGLFEYGRNLPEIKKKKLSIAFHRHYTASSTSPTKTIPHAIGWQPALPLIVGREPTTSRRQEETSGAAL